MGSTFIYLAIYFLLILLYILLIPMAMVFKIVNSLKVYLGKKLFMRYTLIMFFSQYPPMLLSSLINIYNISFNSLLEIVSTSISISVLAVLPFGLAVTYILIKRFRGLNMLEDQGFQEKYSELISSDHKPNLVGSYWKVIVTFRWTITLFVIVFARDHNGLQIIMLLVCSILMQALILGSRPMKESRNQKMSIFNEIATSIYLYVVISLTEFMGETGIRDEIGWGLLVLVGGVVFINLMRLLLKIPGALKYVYYCIKRRYLRSN